MTLPLHAEDPAPRLPSSLAAAGRRALAVYFAVYLLPGTLSLLPVIGPPADEAFAALWSTIASTLGFEPIADGLLNGVGAEEVPQALVGSAVALVAPEQRCSSGRRRHGGGPAAASRRSAAWRARPRCSTTA